MEFSWMSFAQLLRRTLELWVSPEHSQLQGVVLGQALQDLGAGEVHELHQLVSIGENHQLLEVLEVGPQLLGVEVPEHLLHHAGLHILHLDSALLPLLQPRLQHGSEVDRP